MGTLRVDCFSSHIFHAHHCQEWRFCIPVQGLASVNLTSVAKPIPAQPQLSHNTCNGIVSISPYAHSYGVRAVLNI